MGIMYRFQNTYVLYVQMDHFIFLVKKWKRWNLCRFISRSVWWARFLISPCVTVFPIWKDVFYLSHCSLDILLVLWSSPLNTWNFDRVWIICIFEVYYFSFLLCTRYPLLSPNWVGIFEEVLGSWDGRDIS